MSDEGDERLVESVAAIWERFRGANLDRVDALGEAIDLLAAGSLEAGPRREAERNAHKLAGSLGTYGLTEASWLARQIELALQGKAAVDRATDTVLRRLGDLLRHAFRGEDVVARWGGEEFVVALFGSTREAGVRRLTELLHLLSREPISAPDGRRFSVTFSAGVAEFPEDGTDLDSLCRAADQALYLAKHAGRNRVLAYGRAPP